MLPDAFWNRKSAEPALNIKETDDNFEIELAAPSFSEKNFNVTIDNSCLNISDEKSNEKKEKEHKYIRREFSYNSFQRSLQLPECIKEEEIKAKYNDGILSFKLGNKEEAKKRKSQMIEVA